MSAEPLPIAVASLHTAPTGRIPIGVTPSWRAAAERCGGQCECNDPGCKHHSNNRCPRALRYNDRLFVAPDGAMRCGKCHDRATTAAKQSAAQATAEAPPAYEIDSLF